MEDNQIPPYGYPPQQFAPQPEQPYQAPPQHTEHPHHQPYHQPPQPHPHQARHHQPHNHYPATAEPSPTGYSGARSIEYVFMTIALLATALGLILTLILSTSGSFREGSTLSGVAYPVAMLTIALPLYAWLLFDLKRAELHDPSLSRSIYRRLSNQLVRVVTFTTCFFTVIGLVFGIFAHAAADNAGSVGHLFLNSFFIVLVAGAILAYYMRYEA
jgi:hypothetical protein